MAREPGAGWRRGWGYMGGGWGVRVLPAPGLGLQPSCQPSHSHGEGGCTCLGGYSPSPWQGPVVPGQAGSWELMEDVSCGSLLEAPCFSLGSSPDSRAAYLQGQGEHCARGQRGSRGPWVVGCRDPRLQG